MHPGVDLERLRRRSRPRPTGPVLLLGAIVGWKRPDLALEAVAARARGAACGWWASRSWTPGGACWTACAAAREQPDLAGRVEFAGAVDDPAAELAARLVPAALRRRRALRPRGGRGAGLRPTRGGARRGGPGRAGRRQLRPPLPPRRRRRRRPGALGRGRWATASTPVRGRAHPGRGHGRHWRHPPPLPRAGARPSPGRRRAAMPRWSRSSTTPRTSCAPCCASVERHLPGAERGRGRLGLGRRRRRSVARAAGRDGGRAGRERRLRTGGQRRAWPRPTTAGDHRRQPRPRAGRRLAGGAGRRGCARTARPAAGAGAAAPRRHPPGLRAPPPLLGARAGRDALVPPAVLPGPARLPADPWLADEPRRVGWAVGCLPGRADRDLLRRLGPFSEEIFLYGEDLDLGLRAPSRASRRGSGPGARVLHHHGHATRRDGERFELLARQRREVVERRLGPARRRRDDAAQLVTFASRIALKTLLRRPAERERAQLAALRRARRGAVCRARHPRTSSSSTSSSSSRRCRRRSTTCTTTSRARGAGSRRWGPPAPASPRGDRPGPPRPAARGDQAVPLANRGEPLRCQSRDRRPLAGFVHPAPDRLVVGRPGPPDVERPVAHPGIVLLPAGGVEHVLRGHAAERLRRLQPAAGRRARTPGARALSNSASRSSTRQSTASALGDRPVAGMLSGVGLSGQRPLGGELCRAAPLGRPSLPDLEEGVQAAAPRARTAGAPQCPPRPRRATSRPP